VRPRKLTYDDFLLFPDDGLRHELIDGEHYVTASPVTRHQLIAGRLYFEIESYLRTHPGTGQLFLAPFDVVLSYWDVVEPDLLFADTVIIGNPAIADAVIRDTQTLVITGRSYGTTNLIVLDVDGQPIADELLTVQAADDYLVTVYVGGKRATYSCTPACQPTISVGDDLELFDARVGQVQGAGALSR
jgi:hypothetical protein